MRRPSISVRLRSALALVGLIMSSTMVVWAMPCDDDCRSNMTEHSCCASERQPTEDTRATAPDCCGGTYMHCTGTTAVAPDGASSAHEVTRAVAIVRTPRSLPRLEPFPQTTSNERAGPPRPPPVPTKTIVLLI